MMSGRVLINAYGCIYSATSRQWLAFVRATAKGEVPDVPGRLLGAAHNVTDLDRRDAELLLDNICERCGGELPSKLYSMIHKASDEEVDKLTVRCDCGNPWNHTIRAARRRWRKRNEETE